MRTLQKIFLGLLTLALFNCSTYNSLDGFYEAHKNDNQVTAIRVPKFMLTLLSESSPEMKTMIGGTKDLRYMRFPSATEAQTKFLNNQMNSLTGTSFIEVFRKNDELKRNVVAVREKRDVVKEILVYNNNNTMGSFLYFSGNFDPVKVRELAKSDKFEEMSSSLLSEFNATTPPLAPEN